MPNNIRQYMSYKIAIVAMSTAQSAHLVLFVLWKWPTHEAARKVACRFEATSGFSANQPAKDDRHTRPVLRSGFLRPERPFPGGQLCG
jgi:hypothetical protein